MGCCGNKTGCKQTPEASFTLRPGEVLDSLQNVNADFIATLQKIAAAGMDAGRLFRNMDIRNAMLERLTKQIVDLAVENAYFKSVVNLFAPLDIGVTDSVFELNFGPKNIYSLKIPLTQKNNRHEMAKQLRAAADKLDEECLIKNNKKENTAQKTFAFIESHI